MKAIGRLLLLTFLLANLLMLFALSVHVVKSGHDVKILAKEHLTLLDTYNDVTNWTSEDAMQHPALVERMMATGHGDMIAGLTNSGTSPSAFLDSLVHGALHH